MSSRSRRATRRQLSKSRTGQSDDLAVMRATSIPDLLGCVPVALGFHPRRSLVAIALNGKRFGFRVRTDLPAPERVEACAAQILPPLLDASPDAVLLVAYIEPEKNAETRSLERLAADALVSKLRRRLAQHGVEVAEALRCDGSRYWSYKCQREECCPAEGTPYDIESSATLANAVFEGVEVLSDRTDYEQRFVGVQGRRLAEMEAVTERMVGDVLAAADIDADDDATWDIPLLGQNPGLLRAGAAYVGDLLCDLGPDRAANLSDEDAARLSIWTLLLPVRDLAWSYIDHQNVERHLQLWTGVAQRAVPPFRSAPLCLAAFASWLTGNGTQAKCALDKVAEVEPGYSMRSLLMGLLEGWVPPSAWRPLDPELIRAPFPADSQVRQPT